MPTTTIESAAAGAAAQACWICRSPRLSLVKSGNLPKRLCCAEFQITNSDYGRTGDIFRCGECGFHQCSDMSDVLGYYADMADETYESTRTERAIQERALLNGLGPPAAKACLLDVGAGSGILVEQAIALGYDAAGVEPSRALHERAVALGLPVQLGVLPHGNLRGPYDVVTCVDVIEHVPDPVGLLKDVASVISNDGVAVIVTPDRGSVMARIMGWKWWHYRIAHIGYFDRTTLVRALEAADLSVVRWYRPGWYFPANYLFNRVMRYVPGFMRVPAPAFLGKFVIPLNLRDSLAVVCRKIR